MWWYLGGKETKTNDTPVAIVSNDNGTTFGPILKLSKNGTIGSNEE